MGNEYSIPLNKYLIVGNSVTQILKRIDSYSGDDKLEKFVLEYFAGITSCAQLVLETTYNKDGATKLARFEINPPGPVKFSIERAENNLLKLVNTDDFGKAGIFSFVNESKDRRGELTKTSVACNGSEEEGSLVVVEEKRKSGDEKPYVVTVAHYYGISSHFFWGLKSYEAGLSMTVNVTVLNNELFLVRSPRHNVSPGALLSMFRQVCRTKSWKWSTCPYSHAENCRKQFVRINRHLFKANSETETGTETETETEDEEGSYVQLTKQIGSNVLANQGAIRGTNNGNMVVKNLYLRGRK